MKQSPVTKTLIGLALAGAVALSLAACRGESAAATCVNDKNCLPDVTYVDTNGVAYTRKTLADKVVVINFFATWCSPCLKEIPDFSRVSERYKDKGVVFLGVLTSDNPDNATLLNFQSDHDMTFPVIRATSDILVSFQYPGSLPTTFIYDRHGRQVHSHVGTLHADKLTQLLDPLL